MPLYCRSHYCSLQSHWYNQSVLLLPQSCLSLPYQKRAAVFPIRQPPDLLSIKSGQALSPVLFITLAIYSFIYTFLPLIQYAINFCKQLSVLKLSYPKSQNFFVVCEMTLCIFKYNLICKIKHSRRLPLFPPIPPIIAFIQNTHLCPLITGGNGGIDG